MLRGWLLGLGLLTGVAAPLAGEVTVIDAGAAAVVAPKEKQHRAEAEPVVAGQPRDEYS